MVETILFRGNFTHRLGFKPEPMCLNVVGLSISMVYHFQNFIHAQNPQRPDESGKLHEAQGTANKRKQRPKEARLRLILALPLRE